MPAVNPTSAQAPLRRGCGPALPVQRAEIPAWCQDPGAKCYWPLPDRPRTHLCPVLGTLYLHGVLPRQQEGSRTMAMQLAFELLDMTIQDLPQILAANRHLEDIAGQVHLRWPSTVRTIWWHRATAPWFRRDGSIRIAS